MKIGPSYPHISEKYGKAPQWSRWKWLQSMELEIGQCRGGGGGGGGGGKPDNNTV